MNNIIKTCLHCNKVLEKGRLDKKFCDYFCRNAYNNANIRESEKVIRDINQILRRNRSILKSINPEGKTVIRKESLLLQGFNFNYFTHKYDTKNGTTYWFCYEFGYAFSNREFDKVVIVNWQNYMVAGSSSK
jgi:hypothetical protein